MDFTPSAEQVDAAALARTILAARCTQERLRAVESTGTRFDPDLWHELGEAGLVGLHLPEHLGGGGTGLLEACSVAVEVGRAVAPVPLPWHAAAALALAEHGTPDQQQEWLPAAASAGSVLAVALSEDRSPVPERPVTTAERDSGGWVLTGSKTVVPAGTVADCLLVPATTADGVRVFLVRPGDPGVRVEAQRVNDGDSAARLELDGVRLADDRVLGQTRADVAESLAERVTVLMCAVQLGLVEGALELTASYAGSREQFGRPIGTFQAVSQRLADGYMDVHGLRLTLWQVAWRLSEHLPASVEVATAKLWAADAGHRVAHTTVHVHGGVGIDLDGPAHRYFTAAKRLELTLGASTSQALAVGRALAAEPA